MKELLWHIAVAISITGTVTWLAWLGLKAEIDDMMYFWDIDHPRE